MPVPLLTTNIIRKIHFVKSGIIPLQLGLEMGGQCGKDGAADGALSRKECFDHCAFMGHDGGGIIGG